MNLINSTLISLVVASSAFSTACGSMTTDDENLLEAMEFEQLDPSGEAQPESAEEAESALFASTSLLWSPASGSNVTVLRACWKNPNDPGAGPASDRVRRRTWAQDAVNSTWGSSWLDFQWSTSCSGNEEITIYLDDSKSNPHTNGLGKNHGSVTLNHRFDNWSTGRCQNSEKDMKDCIERVAVHEFGHAIGLAHEQNRGDLDCPDGPTQGTNGDLPMSRPDPDSIMSYCPGGAWSGPLLSELDKLHVERLYGGWSAPVVSGGTFALRPQAGWFYKIDKANDSKNTTLRVAKSSPRIRERDGSLNAMVVTKRNGSGRVHYGDEVSLRDSRTGLFYCPGELTQVHSPACGQCQGSVSTIKITAGSTEECWWTPEWTPSQVGGSEIHVNDPLVLKSKGQSFSGSDTASLRFLGHFFPPND